MPWGDSKIGDGCCDIVGNQRYLERADVVLYRTWTWRKFMMTMTPSVFKLVWPWTLSYLIFAAAISMIHEHVAYIALPDKSVLKIFTTPTAFLLLFRCNMGYARFWEGRGHYGVFNFALREVTRRCYTFIRGSDIHDPAAATVRHNVLRLLMVMAMCVRMNLRKRSMGIEARDEALDQVRPHLTVKEFAMFESVKENRPLMIMSWIGKWVHQAYLDGYLPQKQMLMSFDRNVSQLLKGWMGMHKVSYQPIPFPYIHALHWFMFVWMMIANFTLLESFDPWTFIVVMTISATALYSLEEMAAEIEDPFGDDLNDLATEVFEKGLRRDGISTLSHHGVLDQHFVHDIDPATTKLPVEERDPIFKHGQLPFKPHLLSAEEFDRQGGLAGFVESRAKEIVSPRRMEQMLHGAPAESTPRESAERTPRVESAERAARKERRSKDKKSRSRRASRDSSLHPAGPKESVPAEGIFGEPLKPPIAKSRRRGSKSKAQDRDRERERASRESNLEEDGQWSGEPGQCENVTI